VTPSDKVNDFWFFFDHLLNKIPMIKKKKMLVD